MRNLTITYAGDQAEILAQLLPLGCEVKLVVDGLAIVTAPPHVHETLAGNGAHPVAPPQDSVEL